MSPSGTHEPLLHDKVALVTGAAGAIGYGVCKGLLENGCRLAAADLPGDKLDRLTHDLSAVAPDRVLGIGMDVTDPDSVSGGFGRIVKAWGKLNIVVHVAGIATVAKLMDTKLGDFQRLERVNIEGTLLTLAEAGRVFVHQGTGGDIVLISTKNVFSPGAGFGAYSATKAAAHQLARIASLEFAEWDVRVNMVAPDAVFSEGDYKSGLWEEVGAVRMKARGLDAKGLQEYYRKRNLLQASVTGRDVANAVLFFVTRQTPTTGVTLPVDGGLPDATPR
jgi:NAD(P)-dependent dehydrogenase (short-subunit alcohol dehydrogenase family)